VVLYDYHDYMSTPFVHLHGVDRNNFTFTLYGTYNKLTKSYTVKYTSLNYFYMILLILKIQFVLLNSKCVSFIHTNSCTFSYNYVSVF